MPLQLLARDGESRLEDTAFIHLGALVDALMTLESVVEVTMQ